MRGVRLLALALVLSARRAAHSATPSTVDEVARYQQCGTTTADELARLSVRERARVLRRPTLVRGALAPSWPLAARDPTRDVRCRRNVSLITRGVPLDATAPRGCNRGRRYHDTPGCATLHSTLQRLFPTPAWLKRSDSRRLLSVMRGGGVSYHSNHGFAWLGLLHGSKAWFFRDADHRTAMVDPACKGLRTASADERWRAAIHHVRERNDTTLCVQHAGDLVVSPTAWWHATCQLSDGVVVGVGGQDDCDGRVEHASPQLRRTLRLPTAMYHTAIADEAEPCHGLFGRALDAATDDRVVHETHLGPNDVWTAHSVARAALCTPEHRARWVACMVGAEQ